MRGYQPIGAFFMIGLNKRIRIAVKPFQITNAMKKYFTIHSAKEVQGTVKMPGCKK